LPLSSSRPCLSGGGSHIVFPAPPAGPSAQPSSYYLSSLYPFPASAIRCCGPLPPNKLPSRYWKAIPGSLCLPSTAPWPVSGKPSPPPSATASSNPSPDRAANPSISPFPLSCCLSGESSYWLPFAPSGLPLRAGVRPGTPNLIGANSPQLTRTRRTTHPPRAPKLPRKQTPLCPGRHAQHRLLCPLRRNHRPLP